MLRWLPADEGLAVLGREAADDRARARSARSATGTNPAGRRGRSGVVATVSSLTRPIAAAFSRSRHRHQLTPYPCRLPDGRIGRTAIVRSGDGWAAVCVLA